jgi:hypothetical protein
MLQVTFYQFPVTAAGLLIRPGTTLPPRWTAGARLAASKRR